MEDIPMSGNIQYKTRERFYYGIALLSILIFVAALFYPIPGMSTPKPPTQHNLPVEIGDDELAELRGRYTSLGKVLYFGISMLSKWVTETGETLRAGLELGFSLTGRQHNVSQTSEKEKSVSENRPFRSGASLSSPFPSPSSKSAKKLEATPGIAGTAPLVTPANAAGYGPPQHHASVGKESNTSGVIQRIHVAGKLNKIANDIGMDIQLENPSDPPAPFDATAPEPSQSTRQISFDRSLSFSRTKNDSRQIELDNHVEPSPTASEPASQTRIEDDPYPTVYVGTLVPERLSNGAQANSFIERGRAGVSIKVPGVGELKQQIGKGDAESVKGVLQQVVLAGNRHQIKNSLRLQAILQGKPPIQTPDVRSSLRSLIHLQTQR